MLWLLFDELFSCCAADRGRYGPFVVQPSARLLAAGSVIMRGPGRGHPDDIILAKPPGAPAVTVTSASSRRGEKLVSPSGKGGTIVTIVTTLVTGGRRARIVTIVI